VRYPLAVYCCERRVLEPLTETGPSTHDASLTPGAGTSSPAGFRPQPTVLLPTAHFICCVGATSPPTSCYFIIGTGYYLNRSIAGPGLSRPPGMAFLLRWPDLDDRLVSLRG